MISLNTIFKTGALWLTIIGGLNWGLVGLAGFDLVQLIFYDFPDLMRVVYILVGLSALYVAFNTVCAEPPQRKVG